MTTRYRSEPPSRFNVSCKVPRMTLRDQIDQDLKRAMLDKNETARDSLRQVKSEFILREVDLGRGLEDGEVIDVIKKSVKQRRDAIDSFRDGGRMDLVEAEEKQLAVLEAYLPKSLSVEETRVAMEAIVKEMGLSSKKEMGVLMKELKARHPNVDAKTASQLTGTFLS